MLWVIYALLSAFFMAMRGVFGKRAMQHEHALEFGAAQGLLSLIVLAALLPVFWTPLPWQLILVIYVLSVIFTAGNLYFLKSLRHSELSSALPLMNISPLFLLVIAFALLGEAPTKHSTIGVILLLIGTYLLQTGTGRKGIMAPFKELLKRRYSLYMIFAMLIYSFTATMEKAVVNTHVSVLTLFVLMRVFISVNYLLLEWVKNGLGELRDDLKHDAGNIIPSTFAALGENFFYFLALGVPGALVSLIIPVKRLSTLFGVIAGGTLFKEHRLGMKITACLVMLAGVILIVL